MIKYSISINELKGKIIPFADILQRLNVKITQTHCVIVVVGLLNNCIMSMPFGLVRKVQGIQ